MVSAKQNPPPGYRAPTPVVSESGPDPVFVDADTYIEREDIGPEVYTFVAAGDAIPARLVDMPRQAAKTGEPIKPARRAKRGAMFA